MKHSPSHIKSNSPAEREGKILLLDYFPKWIFWDVDTDQLDWKKDADFIIPRVLDWGSLDSVWDKLELLYPKQMIQYFCIHDAQIFGNENIEKLAEKFDLNPEQFPRYVKELKC